LGIHEHAVVRSDALDRLDQLLAAIDPALLRIYQAHWKVFHVHYAISKRLGEVRVEDDLQAAEQFFIDCS
jgi:hypothetical protein